jgi:transcriptional regulator NrdR family protein
MTCPRCSSAQITVIGKILRGTRTRTRYLCDDCYQRWDETTAILSYALPQPASVQSEYSGRAPASALSNRSTQR